VDQDGESFLNPNNFNSKSMHPKTKTILKSLTILALFALSIQALATWTNPTGVAPANNTQPPINVSLTGQDKDGALIAGGLRSDTSVIGVENALFGALDLPNTSSVLELRSITKGFLPPRMNLVQRNAIATPATGLLIYQTDNAPGFYYFDGTNWMAIGSGGNGGGGGGGGIGGSGTPNTVAKWTATGTLGNSNIKSDTTGIEFSSAFKTGALVLSSENISVNPGNANNLDIGDSPLVYLSGSGSVKCIKKPNPFSAGFKMVYLVNKGSGTITFNYSDPSCAPDDKFRNNTNSDLTLTSRQAVLIRHNAPNHYWEVIQSPN
jgi:hypothetical protein